MADQAALLRELMGHTDHRNVQTVLHGAYATEDRIPSGESVTDYRRLWLDLKAELAREAEGRAESYGTFRDEHSRGSHLVWVPDETAQAVLARMEQAETLAMFREGGKRNE